MKKTSNSPKTPASPTATPGKAPAPADPHKGNQQIEQTARDYERRTKQATMDADHKQKPHLTNSDGRK